MSRLLDLHFISHSNIYMFEPDSDSPQQRTDKLDIKYPSKYERTSQLAI